MSWTSIATQAPMPLRELVRLDHDAVPAVIAVQPGALAELDQHGQVGLLPVILGARGLHRRDGVGLVARGRLAAVN